MSVVPQSVLPEAGAVGTTSPCVLVHATCLAVAGRGVLLRGPSGAGKSDLALRMLTLPNLRLSPTRGTDQDVIPVSLVSDDQVRLQVQDGSLWAWAPATIIGKLEVRGIGIVDAPCLPRCRLSLVVDLVAKSEIERMPADRQTIEILAISLAHMKLDPFEASAPVKLALAVARLEAMAT